MALGRAYRRGPSRSRPLVRLHRPLPYHTIPYHAQLPRVPQFSSCCYLPLAARTCCTFSPTTFSSVQFSSVQYLPSVLWFALGFFSSLVSSDLSSVQFSHHTIPVSAGWHHTNDHGWLFKRSPRFTDGIYREAGLFLTTPFTEGCDGVNYQTLPPGRSNMLYF